MKALWLAVLCFPSSLLERHALQVAQGVTKSFQCNAEVDWLEDTEKYYPPTVNDKETYSFAVQVGKRSAPFPCAHAIHTI